MRRLLPGQYGARVTRARAREWRTKAIYVSDREDAMLIAAKLVCDGFEFEYYDGEQSSVFRAHTPEGHKYLKALMKQR